MKILILLLSITFVFQWTQAQFEPELYVGAKGFAKRVTNLSNVKTQEINQVGIRLFGTSTTELSKFLADYKHIDGLTIVADSLINLGDVLHGLTKLEYLELDCPQLKELPNEIGLCKQLKQIYISDSQLDGLPESFRDLENLESLEIRKANFESFPIAIVKLKNGLHNLTLDVKNITQLPDDFYELKHRANENNSKGSILLSNASLLKKLPENFGSLGFLVIIYDAESLVDVSSLQAEYAPFELRLLGLTGRHQLRRILKSVKNPRNLSLTLGMENCPPLFPRAYKKINGINRLELSCCSKKNYSNKKARLIKRLPDTPVIFY